MICRLACFFKSHKEIYAYWRMRNEKNASYIMSIECTFRCQFGLGKEFVRESDFRMTNVANWLHWKTTTSRNSHNALYTISMKMSKSTFEILEHPVCYLLHNYFLYCLITLGHAVLTVYRVSMKEKDFFCFDLNRNENSSSASRSENTLARKHFCKSGNYFSRRPENFRP